MKGNSLTIRSLVICLFALNLTGCAAVVLGGAAMGVKVIHDRRSAGTLVEDQEIWIKAMEAKDSEEQLRQNSNIDIDDLIIRNVIADQGPTLKRFRARARGRGTRILKRTAHITVILGERTL